MKKQYKLFKGTSVSESIYLFVQQYKHHIFLFIAVKNPVHIVGNAIKIRREINFMDFLNGT